MRLPSVDISREIGSRIIYLMGAVDYSKFIDGTNLYQTKSYGKNSRSIYKLLYRYAKEELHLDISNLKYRADDGSLGCYEADEDLIELSPAPPGSKLITLVHEIGHALISLGLGSSKKYNARYEEIIVETSAYVVLLVLGLKISDVNYLKKKRARSGSIERYSDEIRIISTQILEWIYNHKSGV